MADYQTIEAASAAPRGFAVVAKASGSAIITGTVNYYLKSLSGTNAGKWWRDSDQTWQAAETANAMTYQSGDADWTFTFTSTSPFTTGVYFLEYAKESGSLHIPSSRFLKCEYTPSASSARNSPIDLTQVLPTTPVANSVGEALFLADILGGRINTAQGGTSTTITLDAGASTSALAYVGDAIYLYGGTGGGIRGAGQRRTIVAYNTSTKVATVDRAWDTTPDNTSKFITMPVPKSDVFLWQATKTATPDTAGYPKVTSKTGTGTGEILLASGQVTPSTTSTIIVTPASSTVSTGAVTSSDLTAYEGSAPAFIFAVVDATGAPIDLSAKTVKFTASADGTDDPLVTGPIAATISGGSNNQATVQLATTDTASVQTLLYSLWNETDNLILARGRLSIKIAAQQA